MDTPKETKPKSRGTDGTAYDNILVKRNMDGVDAMQGIETLTSLALAEYWDAPNGEKNMDDDDYDCENENIVAKRSAAGWVLCATCGVDVHDEDIAEGTGCDCTDV
tara:strand:+ start:220 stop:537 length:318 start_codon:yes stop_codon:yes gene_type:complete